MLRSDWDHDGVIHSNMEVHRQSDGQFKAHFPNAPQVPPAIGRSENEAINLAKQAMEKAHETGTVGN